MPTTQSKAADAKTTVRSKIPFTNEQFPDDGKSRIAATVAVAPSKAYSFFRNFRNLPLFMKDLASVDVLSDSKSRWTVEVKGLKAEWDAEIVAERPDEMISWKSIKGSEVETSGTIWFSPAPEALGTVISLALDYKVPGGRLTELFSMMSGEDPKSLALVNLRRLKCYLETGEIATIDGQSSGRDEAAQTILKH